MKPTIWIVDDDRSITESLHLLLESVGRYVETFNLAENFLRSYDPERPGCILLDERMPGMSGRELQEELLRRRAPSPIILMTAHADVELALDAMRLGAVTLIEKPFRDQVLFEAIAEALQRDFDARRRHRDRQELQTRIGRLTKRQREVMELVIRGLPNKLVAEELHISERTVELHRARMFKSMDVTSAAELAYAVGRLRSDA